MADQPDNLFEGKQVETPPTNDNPLSKYLDQLGNIKNENGERKYDTLDKALDALRHSQEFIPELKTKLSQREQELEELRGKVSQFENIEDVVARLVEQRQPNGEGNPPAASALDEKAVLELVRKTLTQTEAQKLAEINRKRVEDELMAKFGEKTKEAIAAKAAELGITSEKLGQLAAESPTLVLKHFEVEAKTINPPGGGHNVPPVNKQTHDIEPPTKPLLSRGTAKDREDYMAYLYKQTLAKHGITQ